MSPQLRPNKQLILDAGARLQVAPDTGAGSLTYPLNATFAGTVLHELSHALSGAPDMSIEFEQKLTEELGAIVARQLARRAG